MASIVPGYEYDIFISYRQKDNKHDGWVTKFVENLKGELEAAFKEDVSVYFDENPHDRLQETHNVDKSLEGKLKCLIFIPVLSQTYCDPNNYAWQYEFLAFTKLAKEDRYGRDIRLRNGNFASRILPIRIHDLEQEDIKLFEKETGSVLRAMDFVFKTAAGVNRPLKVNEDHPQDNLNKTYYSDQINKVANAIKEIIQGLSAEPAKVIKETDQTKESFKKVGKDESRVSQEKPVKTVSRKLLYPVAIVALLIIAGIIAYPKIFKKDTLESLRAKGKNVVAVMPFQNMTNEDTLNYLQEAIQDNLITLLATYQDELTVRQAQSINSLIQSKGLTNLSTLTRPIASEISKKLDANIFIQGSIIKFGSIMRVNAQLINSKTDEVFKSFERDGPYNAKMIFQIIDSLRKDVANFLRISKLGMELSSPELSAMATTKSPDAYKDYISGVKAFMKYDYPNAINSCLQSVKRDSNFIGPNIFLIMEYRNSRLYDQAKKWCQKVYKKRDQMPRELQPLIDWQYAHLFETPNKAILACRQILAFDDQQPFYYSQIGDYYNWMYQYDKAITELETGLKIYKKWGLKPWWNGSYAALGTAYHKTEHYRKENKIYRKAEKDFPDNLGIIRRHAILSLARGRMKAANEYLDKYLSIGKQNSWSEASKASNLAGIYNEADILDSAELYFRKAHTLKPDSVRINNLAYFLIDKDRDISQGLELVDKALELSPENYNYLHTKGWGLYKQDKYQEAFDLLDKSWKIRMEKAVYDHSAKLHCDSAIIAVASLK